MNTKVSFIHLENSDKLRAYAEKKAQKIKRYMPASSVAHFILTVNKLSHQAEITTSGYSLNMVGRAKSGDMYGSIDRAVDKLEKQLHRYHDRLRDRRVADGKRQRLTVHAFSDGAESKPARVSIETKQVESHPMLVDEAVMQMNLGQQSVLIFWNAESDKLSVLQRKKGNEYILTESL